MLNKIEKLNIGDTVITKDNEKGIIVQVNSISYSNYQNKLSGQDKFMGMLIKFDVNDNNKHENTFYKDVVIYVEQNNSLLGVSVENIKTVYKNKYSIINRLKKIFRL